MRTPPPVRGITAKTTLALAYTLAVISFAVGIWLSWRVFPGDFDWRYRVISTLQSPKHNPNGYRWSSLGIGLSGLLLWPLAGYLSTALSRFSPSGARLVRRSISIGCIAMILIALFTHRPAFFPRLHEYLALTAYVALFIGVSSTIALFIRHPAATILPFYRYKRIALSLLAFAAVVPLACAALLQLYSYLFPLSDLAPIDLSSNETRVAPYLGFPFWQWIVTMQLYALLGVVAWLAHPNRQN